FLSTRNVMSMDLAGGLIGNLHSTLLVLEALASRLATDKFGNHFIQAERTIRSLRYELDELRRGSRSISWLSHPEQYAEPLDKIQLHLTQVWQSILHMERLQRKFSFGHRTFFSQEINLIRNSAQLSHCSIEMLESIRGRATQGKLSISSSRTKALDLYSEDFSTIHQRLNPPAVLYQPGMATQELFAWLAISAGQDEFEIECDEQQELHNECQLEHIPGTGDWFLRASKFEIWRDHVPNGEQRILWCQGKPGIGKTMLACRVIDELRNEQLVPYFYMNNGRQRSANELAASLLKQLCLPFHIMPQRLKNIYQRKLDGHDERPELDDLLAALWETSQEVRQPVYIVIDALD
ncbi:MAG: hypothetical protein Q9214_007642, partial [Letrouitia sp. 1 TL-2023]